MNAVKRYYPSGTTGSGDCTAGPDTGSLASLSPSEVRRFGVKDQFDGFLGQ